MARLPLIVACGPYDRTRALAGSRVRIEGVEFRYIKLDPEEIFFRMLSYGDRSYQVGPGDLFAVPSWATVTIHADEQLDALRFSDERVYEAPGLARVQLGTGPGTPGPATTGAGA